MDRLREERGAVAIQIALMLPIMIIIVLGGLEVWKVLYMQQVLNDAAYQGARVLVMQPAVQDVPKEVENIVRLYVARAPFADPELRANPGSNRLEVRLSYDNGIPFAGDRPLCARLVNVDVRMAWVIGREWGEDASDAWLPFGQQIRLHGHAEGQILCERIQDVIQPPS